jgi:hypothetical protein
VLCPFAEWRGPIPDTNYSGAITNKIGVCHHVIVGTLASADAEFRTAGQYLSAHFGVGDGTDQWPDGHLVQWLDTALVAYAQAAGNWAPISYLSVETAGQPDTPWTKAQLATLAKLDAWLSAAHGFPLALADHGQPGLTTHCHYPSGAPDPAWGAHICPGSVRLTQMPTLLVLANQAAPEGDDMTMPQAVDEQSGGTWTLFTDGGIYTDDGAPYLGGLNNHPEWHADPGVAIAYWKGNGTAGGGLGYKITTYCAAHGGFHFYRFPRSGVYAA